MQEVNSAVIRAAMTEEAAELKGSLLWRTVTYPWNMMNKALGLWAIYSSGADSLKWRTPLPLRVVHAVKEYMGLLAPEDFFKSDMPTLLGDFHMVSKERAVFEAILKGHRDGDLFVHQRSFERIFGYIQSTFPEEEFTYDDCMLTCSPEATKVYRRVITEHFRGDRMKEIIQEEIEKRLDSWADYCKDGANINATIEAQMLASNIITRLLFGREYGDDELAKAVNFINYYVVAQFSKSATEKDDKDFERALSAFNASVNEVLMSGEEIPLFKDKELSDAQKKAMIFIIFFAGQETVASLITYILWDLGKNPESKGELTSDKVHNYFIHAIHDFPPAWGVSRVLKKDAVLLYRLKGEDEARKIFLPKGDWIGAIMLRAAEGIELPEDTEEKLNYAEWMPFGGGAHRCPGEKLAVAEAKALVKALLADFVVTTKDPDQEINKVGQVTLKFDREIYVNITRKEL